MKCPKYSCPFINILNESLKMLMETPIGGVNEIGMCRGDTIIESLKLKEAREYYETHHCNKNHKICPAFIEYEKRKS